MPVVPAAGYPTGPDVPPPISPAPFGEPQDFLRIDARPEAFGAQVGQSMSALGRVLTTSADEFRQVAMERQQLHNNVVSDKAINDFNDKANNLLYGDPNAPPGSPEAVGYYGLRGQDAIDAYPKMRAALQSSREQMRGQLENPMQQLNFDKETRRQMSLEMGRAGIHYDQQYDVFQTDTNKAGATLAKQQQERSVGDDAAFNDAVAAQMRYEYRQLQAQGLANNDNAIWAMQQRVRSEAVKTQIETYLGRNDTNSAARILNQQSGPGGALSAADAARYRTALSDANVSGAVERARAPGGGGGGAAAVPPAPIAPAEYKPLIDQAAAQYNVPPELLTRVLHAENGFNPEGKSSAGAEGIAQFLPSIAKQYGVDVHDPASSISGAAHYLADLHAQTGSWHAALKGYLGGEPMNDPSYTRSGAWQHADQLDRGTTGGGGGQAGLQADYAKRSGAFGTPEEAGRHLTTVTAPGGASFQVHQLAAPQIQGFVNELEGMGYKIDAATSGGYNNRNKVGVGTDEKSEHAFGTAIDINWDRNKQADKVITDLPANIGEIAAKWGLKWGGAFEGKKDAMHFEVAQLLPGGKPVQVASATPTTMTDAGPAAVAAPGGATPAQGGAPIAIGDSIARGFQRFGSAGGTGKDLDAADTTVHAAGGRSPSTILSYLKTQPDGSLNGQPVIFSTGVSNGPAEANLVPQQLAELKRLGAGPISVVGVGTKAGEEGGKHYDLNQYNAQIEQAAKAAGATFLGGLPAVVHPDRSYYAGAMPKTPAAAAGKPQTAPEGAIAYHPNKPPLQNVGGKWVPYMPAGL